MLQKLIKKRKNIRFCDHGDGVKYNALTYSYDPIVILFNH